MTLTHLIEDLRATLERVAPDVEITGIAYDSRRVLPGGLFFALSGEKLDGARFVRQALDAGAVAAVVARDSELSGLPLIRVDEPRRAMALAAARFHRHPSRELTVIAVTGTNGKTTTTYLVESILRAAGRRAGIVGTTGVLIGAELRPAPFTTPEAPELQGLLREMVDAGLGAVALEISSHALVQRRTYDLACDVVIHTNLSHDHLDYHGTLERYLDAKQMLFDGRNLSDPVKRTTAVVNLDDASAPAIVAAARRGQLAVLGYGENAAAGVRLRAIEPERGGLRFELVENGVAHTVALPLLGRYNAWNAAAAFTAATALGIDPKVVVRGLSGARAVPGRLERVDRGQPFDVVVDYAHTPDALAKAIAATREHAAGRILVVFGAGGDRDRAKRPVMGKVAAELADLAWITNDNPRSESPAVIAAEIAAGAPAGRLAIELDRRAAIAAALAAARAGDAVLIAGKGHETTQTVGDRVMPFDDREVARELLGARAGAGR